MSDVIQSLSKVLDLASQRQEIVASNMANLDTPNYRTRDINDFSAEMQRAFASPENTSQAQVQEITGLIERPDGNNVSIDREALTMNDTQLRYHMAAQMLRSQFHLLSTAISEGQ